MNKDEDKEEEEEKNKDDEGKDNEVGMRSRMTTRIRMMMTTAIFKHTFFLILIHSGVRARRAITLTHPVCQDIWNAATSNLIVGTDMTVNQHSIPSLFTFQPSGNAKLTHPAFGNFTGKFLSIFEKFQL